MMNIHLDGNEATSNDERLKERLELYDLVEFKILGDGNCQFRSLSDQLYGTPEHHAYVRETVVNQMKLQPELYQNYVPMPYDHYTHNMSRNGAWGDHLTLQAAADSFGVKIFVITSFKDTCYIELIPQTDHKFDKTIYLSFWAGTHYNSLYPSEELPALNKKKTNKGVSYDEFDYDDDFDYPIVGKAGRRSKKNISRR